MPACIRVTALVLGVAVGTSCRAPDETARVQRPDRAADEAAITALLVQNEAATKRRDAAGVASTFAADADIMFPGGRHVSGREDIRRNEIEFYEMPGFREWHGTVESIRFVTADVAMVEHAGILTLNTGNIADHATVVVVRRDGRWQIAAVRVMTPGT